MDKVLVIAPHPDDETLGCGGSLLKHDKNGDKLSWLICTEVHKGLGWSAKKIQRRKKEIKLVKESYNFESVFSLGIPAAKVDQKPISELAKELGDIAKKLSPNIIYMPYINDVHTDHYIIGKVLQSLIKWFRYPSLKKVLIYETLSETNFNFASQNKFQPNTFNNITDFIDKKINIMKIYKSELKEHPFPRSEDSIKALAVLRGSQSGHKYAEAFNLIFESIK